MSSAKSAQKIGKFHPIGKKTLGVHFWDKKENKICSRYFASKFLGHTTVENC